MPQTKIHEDGSVTINLSLDEALWLGSTFREWDEMGHWTRREDCQNWKRSPIARENRRESIVFQNCLSQMTAGLGRRQMLQLMEAAAQDALQPAPESETKE